MIKFIRRGGRIIPIFPKGKDLITKKLINTRESNKYMKKGLMKMLENDLPKSGAMVHNVANKRMALAGLKYDSPLDRVNKVFKNTKDFIRNNRSKMKEFL